MVGELAQPTPKQIGCSDGKREGDRQAALEQVSAGGSRFVATVAKVVLYGRGGLSARDGPGSAREVDAGVDVRRGILHEDQVSARVEMVVCVELFGQDDRISDVEKAQQAPGKGSPVVGVPLPVEP